MDLDVESVARDEMLEALDQPREAGTTSAHRPRRPVELHDSAGGTECAFASSERCV